MSTVAGIDPDALCSIREREDAEFVPGGSPPHPIERILLAASRSCQAALGIPQTAPDDDKQLEAR